MEESKTIEIKAPKQDNGLYGMPLSCYKLDKAVLLNEENELKMSAICNAIDQFYKGAPFEIFWSNIDGFMIDVKGHGMRKILYNDFTLEDNILTWHNTNNK